MWRSEDNFEELVFLFLHMGSEVVRLGGRGSYLISHPDGQD